MSCDWLKTCSFASPKASNTRNTALPFCIASTRSNRDTELENRVLTVVAESEVMSDNCYVTPSQNTMLAGQVLRRSLAFCQQGGRTDAGKSTDGGQIRFEPEWLDEAGDAANLTMKQSATFPTHNTERACFCRPGTECCLAEVQFLRHRSIASVCRSKLILEESMGAILVS